MLIYAILFLIFFREHIPKAIYFDAIRGAKSNKLIPVNIPEPEAFQDYARLIGISSWHHLIIYARSDNDLFDAARAWWIFKVQLTFKFKFFTFSI